MYTIKDPHQATFPGKSDRHKGQQPPASTTAETDMYTDTKPRCLDASIKAFNEQ
ncbi:hypothetical protein [Pseudomonas lini]|uniref:hypothetical protein n=1 Tax=Pseudomonas lini TaxID=163011 RepID=UPI00345F0EA4